MTGKDGLARLVAPFALLYKYRSILWQTTRTDIRSRFAGSTLGLLWLVIYPLLFLGAYAIVYLYIFKIRFQLFDSNEYVAIIFCGLIPFLGFSEALSLGVGSVVSNANLIKNTLFPIELVPVKAVLISQCTQLVGMALLIMVTIILGKVSIWTPFIILIWILQLIFSMGVVWILSSLNVFVRDLQNIISLVILILMMISPIAYPTEMVPANLRPFLSLNPLYYLITSYQDILMLGHLPQAIILWILAGFSLITFYVGHSFFMKMKAVFSDNV